MAQSSLWQRFQRYLLEYQQHGFSLDISRIPALAPTPQIRSEIEDMIGRIKAFAEDVHAGKISVENGSRFKHLLHIGIGGSALGPQFVSAAITMSIPEVNAFYIGAVIAPYERAVGFYGSLVNINAHDEPGVEAGKEAASKLLQLKKHVRAELSGGEKTAEEIARSVDADPEDVFHLLRHLASNDPSIKVAVGEEAADDQFSLGKSK
jgi:glucose-6-phosphate isomerase